MKKIFLTIIFVVVIYSLSSLKAQEYVIISEIMYDTPLNEVITAPPYSNGEFIELYNAGLTDVELTNWTLNGGGKTEVFTFPANSVIPSQSFVIVAYQHQSGDFYLNHLYPDIYSVPPQKQVFYQKKIVLSNSGEDLILKDKSGIVKDSIFYDGTSNKKKYDRLSADNEDGLDGLSCLSIQRVSALFDPDGNAYPNNSEWITGLVTPFNHNQNFVDPVDYIQNNSKIIFSYDYAGNRISKEIYFPVQNRAKALAKGGVNEDTTLEERLSQNTITIYPNPTQGELKVRIGGDINDLSGGIQIYNSNGSLIVSRQIESEEVQFDIHSQPSGIYYMKIDVNGQTSTWKIIKE